MADDREASTPAWVCWEETGNLPVVHATTGEPVAAGDMQVGLFIGVSTFVSAMSHGFMTLMVAVERDGSWYADSHPERTDFGIIVELFCEEGEWRSGRSSINKAALARIKFPEEDKDG